VKITMQAIYEATMVTQQLARETSSAVKTHTEEIADHEKRLRGLERSVISVVAVGALLQVAIGAAITGIITQLINR
jgi:hypothetical protein